MFSAALMQKHFLSPRYMLGLLSDALSQKKFVSGLKVASTIQSIFHNPNSFTHGLCVIGR